MMAWMISIATVASLVTFIGIAAWAWSGGRAAANRDSAMLPFDLPDESVAAERSQEAKS